MGSARRPRSARRNPQRAYRSRSAAARRRDAIRVFGIVPEAEKPGIVTVGLTRAELRASADAFYDLLRAKRFRKAANHLAREALWALVRAIGKWAAPGDLGEVLVSGLVNPDVFTVRDAEVVAKAIAAKQRAITALPAGGTREVAIDAQRQEQPALTDAQVVRLVQLGRRIEAHFGCPQDIDWCLVDDGFRIVQSRPITTLFPVPESGDQENHVYVSAGHGQMMTDPMRPLGFSMWQLTAMVPMHQAGGRLFVDVTRRLASPASRTSRAGLLDAIGKGDPLIRDALETVFDRGDFVPSLPDAARRAAGRRCSRLDRDRSGRRHRADRAQPGVHRRPGARHPDKGGPALFDFLLEAFEEHKRVLSDPLSMQAIMAGMEATRWLGDKLQEWLGERNAADALTLSAPDNVTPEMGLALLDVADVIRPLPEVVAFLRGVPNEDFLDGLAKLAGGTATRDAIEAYLDRYGMRCVGEIDITRPRWRERPSTLVPVILDNVRNFEPGAAEQRFEQGRQMAQQKEEDVLSRLRALPDGDRKADEAKRMIDRVRTFIGYREHPEYGKYGIISRYFVYKQALLEDAERLLQAGLISEREDAFYLTFQELHEVVRANRVVDQQLIQQRKEAFRAYHAFTPPRVLTSTVKPSTGRTAGTTRRPGPWSAYRSRPGPSKDGPASSSTWRRPISKRATSWSRPLRTPPGRHCSSQSRAW